MQQYKKYVEIVLYGILILICAISLVTKIVPKIDHNCRNLLFLTYEVQIADIEDQINAQGFEVILLERSFFAREYNVAICELRPITN